jgi:signal peptidase II
VTFQFRNVYWLWLTVLTLLLDQVSKQLVAKNMQLFDEIPLLPYLNLKRMHNTGAAFSMFSDSSPLVFVAIGVVVSVGILIWLRRNPRGQTLVAVALSLIMGGALGNVIDRVTRGYVVDFIDFYIGGWHFAAFNIADTAISVGAGFMVLDMLLEMFRKKPQAQPPAANG